MVMRWSSVRSAGTSPPECRVGRRSCSTRTSSTSTRTWWAWRTLDAEDGNWLAGIVAEHAEQTGSLIAQELLADWPSSLRRFAKVMPRDYRRVLDAIALAESEGRNVDEAIMEAKPWLTERFHEGRTATAGAAACRHPHPGLARGVRVVRESKLRTQAARCMDCGIPFCHNGCPLGNLIPGGTT